MGKMRLEKKTEIAWVSLDKVHLKPDADLSGRVFFEGDREQILKSLSRLQANPKIPILDYITRLQTVNSLIFALKTNARSEAIQKL